MDILTVIIELLKIVIATIGGIVIAWYWNQRKHKLEQYRYLDSTYHDLLSLYREKPDFGNSDLTSHYADSWHDEEALHYHYFAMTVHTIMETLFDIFHGSIPDEWEHIFAYHSHLHVAWLYNNREVNRPLYVHTVLTASQKESQTCAPSYGAHRHAPTQQV